MPTSIELSKTSPNLDRIASILRLVGWAGVWVQLGLAAASILMIIFAIGGRSFSRSLAPAPGYPGYPAGINEAASVTTPGIGIGIFWAICGVLVLLFSAYLAFRQTRFARRIRLSHLHHPDMQVKKSDVMRVLRLGIIAGLVGMLCTILGCGATLGVLLSKSIVQPQGVAIYDPTRIIRSLDVFVAMANMNGIAAHFVGVVASLGLFNWLHR